MPRYTVVLTPSVDAAQDVETYARNSGIGNYANTKIDGELKPLYWLGKDQETGEWRRAHITVAQFECSPEDFDKVNAWLSGQDLSNLATEIVNLDFYDIPDPSQTRYAPNPADFKTPLKWCDLDVARTSNIMDFNRRLVAFLNTLSTIERDPVTGRAKTVNGVLDGYRPHYTLAKVDLNKVGPNGTPAAAIAMPEYKGVRKHTLRVETGLSKDTGEFLETNVMAVFDEKGALTKRNGYEIDLAQYQTLRYQAQSVGKQMYWALPAIASRTPSMRDMYSYAVESAESLRQRATNALRPI